MEWKKGQDIEGLCSANIATVEWNGPRLTPSRSMYQATSTKKNKNGNKRQRTMDETLDTAKKRLDAKHNFVDAFVSSNIPMHKLDHPVSALFFSGHFLLFNLFPNKCNKFALNFFCRL